VHFTWFIVQNVGARTFI